MDELINIDVLTFQQFVSESAYGELDVAKDIIKHLRSAGFQGYLVGGCVRDLKIGRTPKDYDVATDARPEQVLKMFPKADMVGAHFGVVIERGVEIATFRSDGAYGDARRPDSVHFERSPKEDAARRDFTVNAMFMDPFTGKILDFFGGQQDLRNRVLRAVGDPYKRFGEDHLRMLRAMRFAAKLGFTIEPDTLAAMKGLAPHIKSVATERVTQEITGALSFPGGPAKSLATMHQTGMLSQLLPEVDSLSSTAFQTTVAVLSNVHHESSSFALAAMFCQLDLNTVRCIAMRQKLSNCETETILGLLGLQQNISAASNRTTLDVLKKLMRDPLFPEALKLYEFRVRAHDPQVRADSLHFIKNLFMHMKPSDLNPTRLISGEDLIKLRYRPGKLFKTILDTIESKQLKNELTSKESALAFIQATFKA